MVGFLLSAVFLKRSMANCIFLFSAPSWTTFAVYFGVGFQHVSTGFRPRVAEARDLRRLRGKVGVSAPTVEEELEDNRSNRSR